MIGCSMPNISVIAVFTRTSDRLKMNGLAGSFPLVNDSDKARGAHSATNTHGYNSILGLAPAALDQGMAGQPRSGHAVGMADRDRAAVDVELFRVDPELVAAMDDLHRKCLVQLPQVDVVDLESVSLEQSGHGIDRSNAHLVRFTTSRDKATEDTQRLQSLLRRELVAHDHSSTGAIRKLTGIAPGNREARSLGRLDACEAFGSRIGTWSLICRERHLLVRDGTGRLVRDCHRGLDRRQFVVKPSGLLRSRRPTLTLQAVFVLAFPRNIVAFR